MRPSYIYNRKRDERRRKNVRKTNNFYIPHVNFHPSTAPSLFFDGALERGGNERVKIFYICVEKLENSRYNFTHVHHIILTISKE